MQRLCSVCYPAFSLERIPAEAGVSRVTLHRLVSLVGWSDTHLRTGHRWRAARAREAKMDIALNGICGSARE